MGDIKSKFTLHPEYKDFVPGKTHLQFGTLSPGIASFLGCAGMACFILLCSAIGLFFMGVGLWAAAEDRAFLNEGRETQAIITNCQMKPVKGGARPLIDYIYTVDQVEYTGQALVAKAGCQFYGTGKYLKAIYLASNPSRMRLTQGLELMESLLRLLGTGVTLLCMPLFSLLFVLAGGHLVYDYLKARAIYPQLKHYGDVIEGEIVSISGYTPAKTTDFRVRVEYQFETPEHKILTGLADAHRQDLKDKELPPVGTPICVLYAHDCAHIML